MIKNKKIEIKDRAGNKVSFKEFKAGSKEALLTHAIPKKQLVAKGIFTRSRLDKLVAEGKLREIAFANEIYFERDEVAKRFKILTDTRVDTETKSIYVWVDWESTGIWIVDEKEGYLMNADYERFGLPQELVARFKYWERWYSDAMPGWNDEQNKTDQKLFDAYGLSLAIDLKRFVGEKHRIIYGQPNHENCLEIVLVEREHVKKEEGRIVPIAVPHKKE